MLDLRGLYFSDPKNDGRITTYVSASENSRSRLTTVRFELSSRIVGNLGAPLTGLSTQTDVTWSEELELDEISNGGESGEAVFLRDPFQEGLQMKIAERKDVHIEGSGDQVART